MSSFDDELWVRCPEKHFGVSNLFLNVLLRREVFGGVVVANLDFVLKKKCIVRVRESMVLSKGLSFGFGFIHEEIASFGGRYEILPLGAQGLHRFGCGGLDSFGGAFGFIVKGKVVVRFYHDLFFQRENFWRWVGVGLTLTNGGLNIGVQLTNLLLQGGLPFRVFLQLRRLSFRESFRGLSVDSLTLAPQVIEFVLLCHQPRKRFFCFLGNASMSIGSSFSSFLVSSSVSSSRMSMPQQTSSVSASSFFSRSLSAACFLLIVF